MNKVVTILTFQILLASVYSCSINNGRRNENTDSEKITSDVISEKSPEIKFEKLEHDFGTVREGELVGFYFKYKNTGKKPLLITAANASCGCTVPDYNKEPLAPGKTGYIKVVFDTSGRSGMQSKSITIESNALHSITILRIKAEIISK